MCNNARCGDAAFGTVNRSRERAQTGKHLEQCGFVRSHEVRQAFHPPFQLACEQRRGDDVAYRVEGILTYVLDVQLIHSHESILQLRQTWISSEHESESVRCLEIVHFVVGCVEAVEGRRFGLVQTGRAESREERGDRARGTSVSKRAHTNPLSLCPLLPLTSSARADSRNP